MIENYVESDNYKGKMAELERGNECDMLDHGAIAIESEDFDKGIDWYFKALKAGCPEAHLRLGLIERHHENDGYRELHYLFDAQKFGLENVEKFKSEEHLSESDQIKLLCAINGLIGGIFEWGTVAIEEDSFKAQEKFHQAGYMGVALLPTILNKVAESIQKNEAFRIGRYIFYTIYSLDSFGNLVFEHGLMDHAKNGYELLVGFINAVKAIRYIDSDLRLTIDENEANSYWMLGRIAQELSDNESAEKNFLKAYRMGNTRAAGNLGFLFKFQGDLDNAISWFLKVVDSDTTGNMQFMLGSTYLARGDFDKAREWLTIGANMGDSRAIALLRKTDWST